MSHLYWTQDRDGWQAGRYRIEVLAPRFFVLSKRTQAAVGRATPIDRIEASSGSLNALKFRADEEARTRVKRRRVLRRLAMLVISVIVLAVASVSSASWAPLGVIVSSSAGLLSLLRVIDGFLERSFEALGQTYQ